MIKNIVRKSFHPGNSLAIAFVVTAVGLGLLGFGLACPPALVFAALGFMAFSAVSAMAYAIDWLARDYSGYQGTQKAAPITGERKLFPSSYLKNCWLRLRNWFINHKIQAALMAIGLVLFFVALVFTAGYFIAPAIFAFMAAGLFGGAIGLTTSFFGAAGFLPFTLCSVLAGVILVLGPTNILDSFRRLISGVYRIYQRWFAQKDANDSAEETDNQSKQGLRVVEEILKTETKPVVSTKTIFAQRKEVAGKQKPFSKKKETFLKNVQLPCQLGAKHLNTMHNHYHKKCSIRIINNGETEFGRQAILENQQEIENEIAVLSDENKKYASYVKKFWSYGCCQGNAYYISDIHVEGSNFAGHAEKLKEIFGHFLTQKNKIRQNLTLDETLELNRLCKESQVNKLFNEKIKAYQAELKSNMNDVCLNKKQCTEEIDQIQKTLKPGERVGYFYTNGHSEKADHFEGLIIQNDRIIKPLSWIGMDVRGKSIQEKDFSKDLLSGISWHVTSLYEANILRSKQDVHPQADQESCVVLGESYLKEFLRNDGEQLREYTLSIPYYPYFNASIPSFNKDAVTYFFFPSPQVLRYSQSKLYNKVICAMLSEGNEVNIDHKGAHDTVKTINGILNETREKAQAKGDNKVMAQIDALSTQLPSFRERWIAEYKKMEEKRSMMDVNGSNEYLNYKSNKMRGIATKTI